MLGVEKIKSTLAFPLSLAKAYTLASADGKISVGDVVYLVEPLTKLQDAITNAKGALEELKELSPEERAQLDAWVQAEFDISNDELEMKIEKGLALALHVAEFVSVV